MMDLKVKLWQQGNPGVAFFLRKVIHEQGLQEWIRLTQEQMQAPLPDPFVIPSRLEFLNRIRTDLTYAAYFFRHAIKEKTFSGAFQLIPRSLGFWCSFWLPHTDIQLSPGRTTDRKLYMHRPLVLYSIVLVKWWQAILLKVQECPHLNPTELRGLEEVVAGLSSFERGIHFGTHRKDLYIKMLQSFSVIRRRGAFKIRIDPVLFEWLQTQIKTF